MNRAAKFALAVRLELRRLARRRAAAGLPAVEAGAGESHQIPTTPADPERDRERLALREEAIYLGWNVYGHW
ncbi:MAG: hypothetical protein KF914_07600 [Rhizobiaceae bacterium]|nr:hypothetical protein [Rhizobiaceae bacterium]